MADWVAKKGDTLPLLTDTIVDSTGAVVNLTGGSVRFVARGLTAVGPAINAAATIVTPASGTVSYTLTATDTANAGSYLVEWHYTLSGGQTGTFPVDGYKELLVEEDLVTPTLVGRLVNLGDAKAHLNIASTDRSHDAEILRMLDGITPVVEFLTGPILQRRYVNETYDGGTSRIVLRHRPIVSVESVTEYRGPIAYGLQQIATPDEGTIYSYMWDPMGEIVRRTVGGGITSFPAGFRQVWVTYTAGYTSVPQNVRLGTLELLRVNYQQTQQGGRPQYGSGSGADDLVGYSVLGFFVPNRVRELLAPSRRAPSIA